LKEPRGGQIHEDQLLFRQIRPIWFKNGRPSSLNFQPLPKDNGMLSVSAASRTTAKASYDHFRAHGGRSSGVMAVTVSEGTQLGLDTFHDPIPSGAPFGPDPAHAVIDFRKSNNREIRRAAKLLRRRACERGWLVGTA
jgi:hypothetical protein